MHSEENKRKWYNDFGEMNIARKALLLDFFFRVSFSLPGRTSQRRESDQQFNEICTATYYFIPSMLLNGLCEYMYIHWILIPFSSSQSSMCTHALQKMKTYPVLHEMIWSSSYYQNISILPSTKAVKMGAYFTMYLFLSFIFRLKKKRSISYERTEK